MALNWKWVVIRRIQVQFTDHDKRKMEAVWARFNIRAAEWNSAFVAYGGSFAQATSELS